MQGAFSERSAGAGPDENAGLLATQLSSPFCSEPSFAPSLSGPAGPAHAFLKAEVGPYEPPDASTFEYLSPRSRAQIGKSAKSSPSAPCVGEATAEPSLFGSGRAGARRGASSSLGKSCNAFSHDDSMLEEARSKALPSSRGGSRAEGSSGPCPQFSSPPGTAQVLPADSLDGVSCKPVSAPPPVEGSCKPVPGARASTVEASSVWGRFFTILSTNHSHFSKFWHSLRSQPPCESPESPPLTLGPSLAQGTCSGLKSR